MGQKVVIYDMDGMLLHDSRFSERYAKEYGVPLEVLTPFFRGPFQKCITGEADLKEELAKGWLKKWQWTGDVDSLLAYWFETDAVLDTEILASVRELQSKGVLCFIGSNQERYRMAYLNRTFGLPTLFNGAFVASSLGCKKPEPEFFAAIMEHLLDTIGDIEKKDVLFFDDDLKNIKGAMEFGFTARQFVTTEQYFSDLRALHYL